MAKVEQRNHARALRRQGLSFREIQAIVGVSKGTLNRWLKDVDLTAEQKQRLLDRSITGREKARMRGAWRNREKRRQRIAAAFELAKREFPDRIVDPLFITGLVLYWAEGSKTAPPFMFVNSDPIAIRTMIEWLVWTGVPKEKIVASVYVHRIYADCGFERFWETVTGLPPSQFRSPVFKRTPHKIKKNPSYMGCCRLVVGSSEFYWKLRAWQEELVRYLGISLPSNLEDEAANYSSARFVREAMPDTGGVISSSS
ncbi:MAG: hypothetical protein ACRDGN_15355 [bacterium]